MVWTRGRGLKEDSLRLEFIIQGHRFDSHTLQLCNESPKLTAKTTQIFDPFNAEGHPGPTFHIPPGTLILEHRALLALGCDLMIRSDAKGPHAQTNPSSPDRKRVRARIGLDRSLAAPALL
jgi:hypothetical protein